MKSRGFIALTSAVVLSLALLALATAASARTLAARAGALLDDSRLVAREAALGCAAAGRLALARDPSYRGGETLTARDVPCAIGAVSHASDAYRFTVRAASGSASAVLSVAVDSRTFAVVEEREVAGTPP
jgi:hypothetical protein